MYVHIPHPALLHKHNLFPAVLLAARSTFVSRVNQIVIKERKKRKIHEVRLLGKSVLLAAQMQSKYACIRHFGIHRSMSNSVSSFDMRDMLLLLICVAGAGS